MLICITSTKEKKANSLMYKRIIDWESTLKNYFFIVIQLNWLIWPTQIINFINRENYS